jgi:hypothetical protein
MRTNYNSPLAPDVLGPAPEFPIESNIARYDLGPENIKVLCREFINQREQKPEERFGFYLIDGKNVFSNLGRYVESTVLDEYFHNSPEQMRREYGPYDNHSEFLVGIDQENEVPTGSMRVILPSEIGQKSLNDLRRTKLNISPETVYSAYNIDPEKCLDVAIVAVMRDYRGDRADNLQSLLLYRALYVRYISDPKYSHVVAIMDLVAKRSIDRYKVPFRPILDTEPFSYLESPLSQAIIAQTSEFFPQVNYWQQRFEQDAKNGDNEDEKGFRAAVMKNLKDGNDIDRMLASEITVNHVQEI